MVTDIFVAWGHKAEKARKSATRDLVAAGAELFLEPKEVLQ